MMKTFQQVVLCAIELAKYVHDKGRSAVAAGKHQAANMPNITLL